MYPRRLIICLDVEGAESLILMQFPLEEYRIKIMTIERLDQKGREFLKKYGYEENVRLGATVLAKACMFTNQYTSCLSIGVFQQNTTANTVFESLSVLDPSMSPKTDFSCIVSFVSHICPLVLQSSFHSLICICAALFIASLASDASFFIETVHAFRSIANLVML